jgi:hypothetical protein
MTEKEQTELKQVIFEIYGDYICQLQNQYPKLTEADLLYSCLASTGLSTFAIALCFGNTDTGIVAQRKPVEAKNGDGRGKRRVKCHNRP